MVKENNGEYLAQVKGNSELSPLLLAVLFGHEEMAYWLYYLTKTSLNHADRIELLLALIRTGFHELALQLLEEHNELAKCLGTIACCQSTRSLEKNQEMFQPMSVLSNL
ncbi:hypothetical protein Pint_07053 [Pistacia integerrima]|uniref:Uncharacterized protein n=1 Tax=Pistacia integerrima TaxID=434235 RepID=A0ACC0XXC4_9ROSI|nr:hypothetical protein Pint_07053 [Pistacia integerrima]